MNNNFNNSKESQQRKILKWLREHRNISKFEALEKLSVLHLPGRVLELRKKGINIVTHTCIEYDTNGNPHENARYVLLPGRFKWEKENG